MTDALTPPPDQAAFRIDYPVFIESRGERNGRIAQLRQRFHDEWNTMHHEDSERERWSVANAPAIDPE